MIISISKFLLKLGVSLLLLASLVYLVIPSPRFPAPTPDSVQSLEEADLETPLRRTYFTNFSRKEILAHFKAELSQPFAFPVPTYIVYYPPEDSQTLIRDQTRTVNLPEIIHPFRESLYVNIFESRSPKDEIWYKGVHYQERVTLKYTPSSAYIRIAVIFSALLMLILIARELGFTIIDTTKKVFSRKFPI